MSDAILPPSTVSETIRGGSSPAACAIVEVSTETMIGAGMSLDEVLHWAARAEVPATPEGE